MKIAFLLLFGAVLLGRHAAAADESEEEQGVFGFKCEDLVPQELRCDLKLTQHSINIRGLSLTYYLYETTEKSENKRPPIVLTNGGPGASHDYIITMKYLACNGTPVLFYDQVGTGESERPEIAGTEAEWLLTTEYYVEELQTLADHVGFSSFYLLGHSWGGMVAQHFALEHPKYLRGLILSSTLSDSNLYAEGQKEYLHSTLPPHMQSIITEAAETGDYDTAAYQSLNHFLTGFWTVRTAPMPDCVAKAFETLNYEIYIGMQGPSEFTISGILENWSLLHRLKEIKTPTLVTAGAFDTMTPPNNEAIVNGIPNAELFIFPHSAHMTQVDDPALSIEKLHEFMDKTERSLNKKEDL